MNLKSIYYYIGKTFLVQYYPSFYEVILISSRVGPTVTGLNLNDGGGKGSSIFYTVPEFEPTTARDVTVCVIIAPH